MMKRGKDDEDEYLMDIDWEYETEAINQNSTVSGGLLVPQRSGAHASASATPTEVNMKC